VRDIRSAKSKPEDRSHNALFDVIGYQTTNENYRRFGEEDRMRFLISKKSTYSARG